MSKTNMSSSKVNISLASFFIFNSSFGPRENEEEKKILYYYPPETHVDTQIKDVGLCEAIIRFTNTFSVEENPCKLLRTQKTVQLFHEPEPGYWMVMIILAPVEKKVDENKDEYNEFKGEHVHEKIFGNVLRQAYNMFRLFSGTLESHVDVGLVDGSPKRLMLQLDEFFSMYMKTLKLNNCDILNVFRSLHYVPLEQDLFLRVHNFIQTIESTFPAIRHCILMQNEQVVWSGINPTDLYSVHEYIVDVIFPKTSKLPSCLNGESRSEGGVFITGPSKFNDSIPIPTVHIFNENQCSRYGLVVYRSSATTFAMFFQESANLTDDTYHELHTALRSQLASIGVAITESKAAASLTELSIMSGTPSGVLVGPRFLFLNELNLKHTGTLHLNHSRPPKQNVVPGKVMNLLTDLFEETNIGNPATEETVLKTLNDYWIVRRSSNWRHFFVVVNKSSTLLSVTEEARVIFDEHARNLFFDK